jgi:hypothetical protein
VKGQPDEVSKQFASDNHQRKDKGKRKSNESCDERDQTVPFAVLPALGRSREPLWFPRESRSDVLSCFELEHVPPLRTIWLRPHWVPGLSFTSSIGCPHLDRMGPTLDLGLQGPLDPTVC